LTTDAGAIAFEYALSLPVLSLGGHNVSYPVNLPPPCPGEPEPPVITLSMKEFMEALKAAKQAKQTELAELFGLDDVPIANESH
jgi:hypothetical protein